MCFVCYIGFVLRCITKLLSKQRSELFMYHHEVLFFSPGDIDFTTKCDNRWMCLAVKTFPSILLAQRLNPALHLPAAALENYCTNLHTYTLYISSKNTHTHTYLHFPDLFLSCTPLQHSKHLKILKLTVNSLFSWGNSPPLRTAQVKKLNFTHRAIKNNPQYLKLSGENPP